MSTQLVNLSVLVGVRVVSYDELQDVEIQADLGSRDSAVVTLSDAKSAAAKYKMSQPLEIKVGNQTRLFRGRIVSQNLRSKLGLPQLVMTGMAEMRPSTTGLFDLRALPRFQDLSHRIESLTFTPMPSGFPWHHVSKTPVDVWKASFAVRGPSETDFATYTLGKYLEFSAHGKAFRGTIDRLEISLHRDARPTKFAVQLIGTVVV
jgi:hypothetical protein